MNEVRPIRVTIVDYGLGNLFSVKHACEYVGMEGVITSSKSEILGADGVILPGVGAFGGAMESLKTLDLIAVLKELAASEVPLVGICLGMQLLMSESHEFGEHTGLDIIKGSVFKFAGPRVDSGEIKVPQVGWKRIARRTEDSWSDTFLEGIEDGDFMYFIHSYYVSSEDENVILSTTTYGDIEFCSSLKYGNVFATQFHPERSGNEGLKIYRNLANHIKQTRRSGCAV